VKHWSHGGQAKIVVKVQTEQDLLDVEAEAKRRGLITYVVQDAGRTQIASGSRTVLAVGPDSLANVDAATGGLKLL